MTENIMKEKISFQDFADIAGTTDEHNRLGQKAYNTLAEFRNDLALQIRGTEKDPFYKNENLPAFWTFVIENWD